MAIIPSDTETFQWFEAPIRYDSVIAGAGLGGLFTGALLAGRGQRVYLCERHSVPGGYGQSFERTRFKSRYVFCAQLHYLWSCLPGLDGARLFKETGLDRKIQFVPLDKDGFDVIKGPGVSYRCRTGFLENIEPLEALFPGNAAKLKAYFDILETLNKELLDLPLGINFITVALNPFRYRHVVRYRNWTVQRLFDQFRFPPALQLILAGQIGNLMVPPSKASLIMFAGMVTGYYSSACVPAVPYQELFDHVVDFIRSKPGCKVVFDNAAREFKTEGAEVVSMETEQGESVVADRFIFNGDPKLLRQMIPHGRFGRRFSRQLNYSYSPGSFAVYLGLKNIDLRQFGFGNWNTWHYAKLDVNDIYVDQYLKEGSGEPSIFISTPTLHHDYGGKIAPYGHAQLVCATIANYGHWQEHRQRGRTHYLAAKKAFAEKIYDVLDKYYIPGIRDYIDLAVTASPLTNERYVASPFGNVYGADLTPSNWKVGKVSFKTPYRNLFLVNATSGIPSFAGGLLGSYLLAEKLAPQRPARPLEGGSTDASGRQDVLLAQSR